MFLKFGFTCLEHGLTNLCQKWNALITFHVQFSSALCTRTQKPIPCTYKHNVYK